MSGGGILRRSAVPPPVRTRQNLKKLDENNPIIRFYSRAIGAMKNNYPLENPLNWRYQGAIHDYPFPDDTFQQRRAADGNRIANDPLAVDGERLPADRDIYWRQCRHNSWFFLPWHRMYLANFEQIVAAHVEQLGGPKDWALPYWDWTATDGEGKIPVTYRRDRFPGGEENHLFVEQRNRFRNTRANAGDVIADEFQRDSAFACLNPTQFVGSGQFGGPPLDGHSGFGRTPDAVPRRAAGLLEDTPHGSMHTATGGSDLGPTNPNPRQANNGWMSLFAQAALDPIFWSHHANIDRIWEIWIQAKPDNKNPELFVGDNLTPDQVRANTFITAFLTQTFKFHNVSKVNGRLVPNDNGDMTVAQVLQTRHAPLSYEYDDTTDPR